MKWRDWLDNWGMTSLKLNLKFLEMEFAPKSQDRHAAWEMYIELLTRVTTQHLEPEHGDEAAALDSIYTLFPLTREAIRRYGVDCQEFAKLAIVVLNQIIRPFTAKWHRAKLGHAFQDAARCREFRSELAQLQASLSTYTRMLGEMAGVESDLRSLDE